MYRYGNIWASQVSGKELPIQEMQEMWGLIPGSGDPLEKEMTAHSSILA